MRIDAWKANERTRFVIDVVWKATGTRVDRDRTLQCDGLEQGVLEHQNGTRRAKVLQSRFRTCSILVFVRNILECDGFTLENDDTPVWRSLISPFVQSAETPNLSAHAVKCQKMPKGRHSCGRGHVEKLQSTSRLVVVLRHVLAFPRGVAQMALGLERR